MEPCPFCRIVAGDGAAHVLDETDETIAFLDNDPAAGGHTLVAPKAHVVDLLLGTDSTADAVFRMAARLSKAIDRALGPDGVSVFYTSGQLVGTVSHAHVHLVPRYEDDEIRLGLRRQSISEGEASRIADHIRAEL